MSPMASQTFLTWTETQTKVTDGVNILMLGQILGKKVYCSFFPSSCIPALSFTVIR